MPVGVGVLLREELPSVDENETGSSELCNSGFLLGNVKWGEDNSITGFGVISRSALDLSFLPLNWDIGTGALS